MESTQYGIGIGIDKQIKQIVNQIILTRQNPEIKPSLHEIKY